MERAKREVEGATWVTDEFESSDYERGNLEAVHDMYLWDREGKTTIMPESEGPEGREASGCFVRTLSPSPFHLPCGGTRTAPPPFSSTPCLLS